MVPYILYYILFPYVSHKTIQFSIIQLYHLVQRRYVEVMGRKIVARPSWLWLLERYPKL